MICANGCCDAKKLTQINSNLQEYVDSLESILRTAKSRINEYREHFDPSDMSDTITDLDDIIPERFGK